VLIDISIMLFEIVHFSKAELPVDENATSTYFVLIGKIMWHCPGIDRNADDCAVVSVGKTRVAGCIIGLFI